MFFVSLLTSSLPLCSDQEAFLGIRNRLASLRVPSKSGTTCSQEHRGRFRRLTASRCGVNWPQCAKSNLLIKKSPVGTKSFVHCKSFFFVINLTLLALIIQQGEEKQSSRKTQSWVLCSLFLLIGSSIEKSVNNCKQTPTKLTSPSPKNRRLKPKTVQCVFE